MLRCRPVGADALDTEAPLMAIPGCGILPSDGGLASAATTLFFVTVHQVSLHHGVVHCVILVGCDILDTEAPLVAIPCCGILLSGGGLTSTSTTFLHDHASDEPVCISRFPSSNLIRDRLAAVYCCQTAVWQALPLSHGLLLRDIVWLQCIVVRRHSGKRLPTLFFVTVHYQVSLSGEHMSFPLRNFLRNID